ncbi:MAG: hypothetical protein ABIH37_01995 [archaeon]
MRFTVARIGFFISIIILVLSLSQMIFNLGFFIIIFAIIVLSGIIFCISGLFNRDRKIAIYGLGIIILSLFINSTLLNGIFYT